MCMSAFNLFFLQDMTIEEFQESLPAHIPSYPLIPSLDNLDITAVYLFLLLYTYKNFLTNIQIFCRFICLQT